MDLARGGGGFLGALFIDRHGRLAGAIAQVVEASPHRLGLALDLNFVDVGRVNGKYALDPLAVADAANREGFVDAMAFASDDDTGINLDALFVAFANFGVNADAVANFEWRKVLFHLKGGNFFDDRIHG